MRGKSFLVLSAIILLMVITTVFAAEMTENQRNELDGLTELCKVDAATAEICIKTMRTTNLLAHLSVNRRCTFPTQEEIAKKFKRFDMDMFTYFLPKMVSDNCIEGEEVFVTLLTAKELGENDGLIDIDQLSDGMKKINFKPADWTILFPFAEKYPYLQKAYMILFLGSVWQPEQTLPSVPLLRAYAGERIIGLHALTGFCSSECRFATVKM